MIAKKRPKKYKKREGVEKQKKGEDLIRTQDFKKEMEFKKCSKILLSSFKI
jgi:hypothetical protein